MRTSLKEFAILVAIILAIVSLVVVCIYPQLWMLIFVTGGCLAYLFTLGDKSLEE